MSDGGGLHRPLLPPADGEARPLSPLAPHASDEVETPRILDRDGRFSQSRGRWSVSSARHRRGRAGPDPGLPAAVSESEMRDLDGGLGTGRGAASDDASRPLPPPGRHRRRGPGRASALRRCLPRTLRSACPSYPGCCCPTDGDDAPPRRCWDDWFHNLSYQPTCLLLMMVFGAYFVTILAFAGLYLTVNEVGRAYAGGHGADGLDGGLWDSGFAGVPGPGLRTAGGPSARPGGGVVGRAPAPRLLSAGTSDSDVPPEFCGMDINNHMEGESGFDLRCRPRSDAVGSGRFRECALPAIRPRRDFSSGEERAKK